MGDRFRNRVAVVTGAGRGIGRAEAMFFAAEGAAVVVNDLGGSPRGGGQSASPADEVVAEIRAAGGVAIANYGSVAKADEAAAIVDAAMAEYGRIDILVNNAGILRDQIGRAHV